MLKLRHTEDSALEVGVDEAGRGTLFGRLYTGAVVLPTDRDNLFDNGAELHRIKDSKKMSKRQRDIVYDYVKELALDCSTAFVEASQVDDMNVLAADMLAMRMALDKLEFKPQRLLIDGNYWTGWGDPPIQHHCVIGGDAQYIAIAGASIFAKVEHDRWIQQVCSENPEWNERYGLLSNMGYGTAKHMLGLKTYGITNQHRLTFKPVRDAQGWLGDA